VGEIVQPGAIFVLINRRRAVQTERLSGVDDLTLTERRVVIKKQKPVSVERGIPPIISPNAKRAMFLE
jgi:hypothetical protein